MDSTVYYDSNAETFCQRTVHLDVRALYQKFLSRLDGKCKILDAGSGSGRDSKFFLSLGHDVTSFDGSLEMCKRTSSLTGKPTLHLRFEDMQFSQEFDAIWAHASLLHVPYENLREILKKFHAALSPSGILFASFKYGSYMRDAGERFFFDMNENNILPYLEGLFEPLEMWKEADTMSTANPSPELAWLNVVAKAKILLPQNVLPG